MRETNKNIKSGGIHFNWGTGIVISFILFCSFIIYIVIRAFQQDIDLVSETYYLDELAYQERIDERSNLAHSGYRVELAQTTEEVVVRFPGSFKNATGEIYFYHPSRELFDKHYVISLDKENQQVINKSELIKGNYKVKINWEVGETAYFQETAIFLR